MDEQINYNLTQASTWRRIFFMLVFAAIGGMVKMILWAVILLQVASTLLTGKANSNILNFGRSLSVYTYHILLFLTYNTETLPFPFSAWNLTADLQQPELNQPPQ
ncbi:conserved hypothetical protein [Candidatus Methylobacter favarea]|uniref:DUF4389 domain-containing protein n=1 Tax=Candidatus Methylobacter favarea TaxID=2707345 RepID=A0A8S0WSC4_9GAMM|nr:DUF4389 domain-containing protein [Candidatus Methylobacter favarea]CAA9892611.1 conserved hypothetical protein [Candidatus Methylobacter favarea]